ncbi:hypothetical protein ACKKBG_A27600 [Auxenochlorella protothecoides x Auxenochlorella symbiontica]
MVSLPVSFRPERAAHPAAPPLLASGSRRTCLEGEETSKLRPHPRWQYLRSLVWIRVVLNLGLLYLLGLAVVASLYSTLPTLEELARRAASRGAPAAASDLRMAIPRSFDELRAVRGTLALYHAQVPARLAALLAAAHIFLQTFLTPGAVGINILAGSLYHPVVALTFITVVSTAGSATNYLMVRWQLKDVLVALFPHRIQTFSAEVKRHRAHLMHYALFLRVTPIFPAWFINVASPIVDIPFSVFIIATAVGHQPHNLITIQAGRSLQTMHSLHDLYSLQNVALLLGIGLLALLPRLIRKLQGRRGPLLPISDPAAAGDGDKTPDHNQ